MPIVQSQVATWWEVCYFDAEVTRFLVRSDWSKGTVGILGGREVEEGYGWRVIWEYNNIV